MERFNLHTHHHIMDVNTTAPHFWNKTQKMAGWATHFWDNTKHWVHLNVLPDHMLFGGLHPIPVVLNLGSIEPQGFLESVSGVWQRWRISKIIFNNTIFWKFVFCWFCSLNTVILCATDAWFILCTNKIQRPMF